MSLPIIPLGANKSAKFIPWMIALMVYLATITSLLAVSINDWVGKWQTSFGSAITVELPPVSGANQNLKTEEVLAYLKGNSIVQAAEIVSREKISKLLKPWLGKEFEAQDLPFPVLIDVTLQNGAAIDSVALQAGVDKIYKGASIEENSRWYSALNKFAGSVQWALFIVLSLMFLTVIGSVNFITRTGLTIHAELISILQLLGSRDDYIASQFQKFVTQIGVRGGSIGVALSILSYMLMFFYAQGMEGFLQLNLQATYIHFAVLFCTPLIIVLFMVLAARRTVLKTLKTQLPS